MVVVVVRGRGLDEVLDLSVRSKIVDEGRRANLTKVQVPQSVRRGMSSCGASHPCSFPTRYRYLVGCNTWVELSFDAARR